MALRTAESCRRASNSLSCLFSAITAVKSLIRPQNRSSPISNPCTAIFLTVDSSLQFVAHTHFSFSDPAMLKSPFLMKALTTVGGLGKLDARRGLSITTTYVRTFFDVERKGTPPTLLESVSSQYPEVQFEPR